MICGVSNFHHGFESCHTRLGVQTGHLDRALEHGFGERVTYLEENNARTLEPICYNDVQCQYSDYRNQWIQDCTRSNYEESFDVNSSSLMTWKTRYNFASSIHSNAEDMHNALSGSLSRNLRGCGYVANENAAQNNANLTSFDCYGSLDDFDQINNLITFDNGKCQSDNFGRDHLSKMHVCKQKDPSKHHDTSSSRKLQCGPEKKKKKRHRPFAAIRERERLLVMNSALEKLKLCLPLKNSNQKLSKREILKTAVFYIKFLMSALEDDYGAEEHKNVNLLEYNYLKRASPWIFMAKQRT